MKHAIFLWGFAQLHAACLAPGLGDQSKECKPHSDVVALRNSVPESRTPLPANPIDPSLTDPAFGSGVAVQGDLTFEWRVPGVQIVEIILNEPKGPQGSFVLEAAGKLLDQRFRRFEGPGRLSPSDRRSIVLVGVVDQGPVVVRSDSPSYLFSAIRWTPAAEFESKMVPALQDRLQDLYQKPYFGIGTRGATWRRNHIDQVASLLRLSSRSIVARNDGMLGQMRAAYWVAAENHRPADIARTTELLAQQLPLLDLSVVGMMISAACAGTNTLTPMMAGDLCLKTQPVSWTVTVPDPPAGAPDWAIAQRRLKYRMDLMTRWWVDQRQQPNGELGGGWGDDVEMLRNWGPLALGLGSEVATRGILRLADGLWTSAEMKDGYSREISDVEHSSEPSTDTIPLRAAITKEDPAGREHLRVTAKCSENWIARQPDGFWRFRGSWYNCAQIDPEPKRAIDVHLNTRAMGPALWSAYFDREPALVERITKWAEAWRMAMRSTRHGKPFGLIPSAMRAKDGEFLIDSKGWDTPNVEWDYYQWSGSSQEAVTSLFLAVHDLTGDAKWLQAAGESFTVMKECTRYRRYCEAMRKSPEAYGEWLRRTTKATGSGAILDRMTAMARDTEKQLSVNFPMYTSEVLWTDRVYYRLPVDYRKHLFGGEAPRGDRFPTFAITWEPIEGDYARAVTKWDERSMELRAYNFESTPLIAPVHLWRLKKGDYRCHVYDMTGKLRYTSLFLATKHPQLLRIPLPAQTEVTVRIVPAE